MGKYFGTDGIRGVAGRELRAETAFRVGAAAAMILTGITHRKPVIIIGKDTRVSSDMLESALIAGVSSVGADVIAAGVVPTPAIAYLAGEEADAGLVISASHNSFEHNGIKFFDRNGYKLPDAVEQAIEEQMEREPDAKIGGAIGRTRYDREAVLRYVNHIATLGTQDLSRLRVAADLSHGAACATAEALFKKLGLRDMTLIHNQPNGTNINENCGSTHMEPLRRRMAEGGYDIGLAFDGDADRCLAVDDKGDLLDGDKILAICALHERQRNTLEKNTIVATVMSNLGLHRFGKIHNIQVETTKVGDRYVLERMVEKGYTLGGEQSGHVIFKNHASTGDGQLTAIKLMDALCASGQKLSELAAMVPEYPQVLVGVSVESSQKDWVMEHQRVINAIRETEEILGEEGRVLVRPSGTEALIRIMIEGKDRAEIVELAKKIADTVKDL